MKKGILFLLLLGFFTGQSHAQSLKDLLYSGKLKKDSNIVIRKGDDLSARIDTSTRKPETEVAKATPVQDSAASGNDLTNNSLAGAATSQKADASTATNAEPVITASTTSNNAAKNNNDVWKEYMDSLVSTLKTDVLPSKKIKDDTYYLYVDYEIGTDGQVSITNVVASPENAFLQDQVKQRLTLTAPSLAPTLDSNGKPRKIKRKYNFNITKS